MICTKILFQIGVKFRAQLDIDLGYKATNLTSQVMNFYSLIENVVQLKPANIAIKIGNERNISYRQLGSEVSRYLNALSALGARGGDRIVVQVEKSLPSLLLYYTITAP